MSSDEVQENEKVIAEDDEYEEISDMKNKKMSLLARSGIF